MGGTGMENYAWGLALLGVGWNFLFVGSTSLITGTYDALEKAKVQSTNDFLVFGAMVLATFSAGTLEQLIGWRAINEVVLGILALFLIIFAVLWVYSSRRLRKDTGWDDTSESSRLTAHTQ
jgi:MFS family permease